MAVSRPPALLVDVDGVLNPFRRRSAGFTVHRLQPSGGTAEYDVALNPAHGGLLTAFAARHGVELVWATMWTDDANLLIGPLVGLPELPVVPIPRQDLADPGRATLGAWKAQHIAAWADRRPFVWLDDESDAAHHLALRREAGEVGDHLVVRVPSGSGLTPRHLAKAAKWFAAVSGPLSA
ncbi:HAD domain-containing protein [Actinocorallia aurea]